MRVDEVASDNPKTIGILALQGDYDAHHKMLSEKLSVSSRYVRTVGDLEQVDALILPGGESTTISKLMERVGLDTAIKARIQSGMPVYGTCAGMILLAHAIEGRPEQPTLDALRITVARNAFGRQIDSFEADVPFVSSSASGASGKEGTAAPKAETAPGSASANSSEDNPASAPSDSVVRGVFIRAPYVTEAGRDVQILSHFRERIVGVRQDNLLATAFHPELTNDASVHAYFLRMVAASAETRAR